MVDTEEASKIIKVKKAIWDQLAFVIKNSSIYYEHYIIVSSIVHNQETHRG